MKLLVNASLRENTGLTIFVLNTCGSYLDCIVEKGIEVDGTHSHHNSSQYILKHV